MTAIGQGLSDYRGEPLGASVRLTNLERNYNGVRAVEDVSLTVEAGEFLSLLGPSGSGKTTTLKMIAGFEDPDRGNVVIGGRSVIGVSASRRNLGMVFQNYALFPHMTVFENVAFPLKMRKQPRGAIRDAVHEALSLVRLEHLAARKPAELSGGQQQRVAFARAVVFRPPLLLMDEPLGALDRKLREEVQHELKRVQKRLGLTVIYVTHDQQEALFLSDTIALMENGRIAQAGSPPELYEKPNSRFVAEFLGESNFISGALIESSGDRAVATLPDGSSIVGRAIGQLEGAVDILVRPEKLDVAAGETIRQAGANRIAGCVEMVNFLGSELEYEIRTSGGALAARSYLRSGFAPLPTGSPVTLSFSSADCMMFSAARK
ncbi:ABC transporter ATP-binding protein [Terrarubrum flagellatum]|uniref:ABC transporter ATP-binding protein n=1 Tax=Terrirubrum flagellatum TaxID=2895980 RepID=UPI0031450A9F